MINLKKNNEIYGVQGVVDLYPEEPLQKGVATISKYNFTQERANYYNADHEDPRLFKMYAGRYVRLHINGHLMMSDTAMERQSNKEIIHCAHGRVLIAGLGIGLIIKPMLENDNVKEIVVIEKYQDVIDLVAPKFKHPKLKIIGADVFEYDMPRDEKFNVIYFDIWADITTDNLKEMRTLHNRYRKNLVRRGYMNSWLREWLKRRRTKELREQRAVRELAADIFGYEETIKL